MGSQVRSVCPRVHREGGERPARGVVRSEGTSVPLASWSRLFWYQHGRAADCCMRRTHWCALSVSQIKGVLAYTLEDAKLEAIGVRANRLQNLAVTLDKVPPGCLVGVAQSIWHQLSLMGAKPLSACTRGQVPRLPSLTLADFRSGSLRRAQMRYMLRQPDQCQDAPLRILTNEEVRCPRVVPRCSRACWLSRLVLCVDAGRGLPLDEHVQLSEPTESVGGQRFEAAAAAVQCHRGAQANG